MPLTPEVIKAKFIQFDTNGNGKLSFDEFKEHISELLRVHVSDAACRTLFDAVNKGSDDVITLDEWMGALNKKSLKDVGEKELHETFAKLDISGDGKITEPELQKALKKMNCKASDEDISELFKEADTSGDGVITVKEFIKAFFSHMKQ